MNVYYSHLLFNRPTFWSYLRLGQSPKLNFLGIDITGLFACWMPFVSHNQQHQSTEGSLMNVCSVINN